MKLGFLLLLTCFCILGFSQDYEMRISNISDEQGIDVPSTFGIAEDPYGFIWFGTVGGLYRYDGYKMRVYRNIESDSTSLSSNTIRTLLVDTLRNKIYIGTQLGGLNIFDLNTQTFTHFMVDRTNPYSITNNSIWSLMLDEKGLLWIGMEDYQLNQFNPDDNKFYKVELQNQNPEILKGSCTIRMLYQEPNNNIWVGTDNHGLYLLESQGFQSHFFEIYNKPNALKNNFIISACNDSKGNFWIATFGGGIAKYIAKTKVFEHVANHRESNLGPISGLAYSIIAGTDNSLWVGTEYGLSNMNTITFQANHYEQQFSSNEGLTDNRIRKLFRDSQGILWIGTEAGVDKMVTQTNFKSFQHQMGKTNSLPGGIVRAIYKDKNDALWIGLIDKGLVKYNNKTKEYTHYIDGKFVTGNIICYQVSAIFEDSKNNFWIGDWEKGLLKFDRKNQKFTNEISTFYGKNRLVDNRIQVIREDFDETLWLGTESGIARYNPTTKDIEYIVHDADNPNSLSGNAVQAQALVIDNKNNLWAGTWAHGLNYIEITNREPLQYNVSRFIGSESNQWLSNNNVISLYQQNDSILWIGTFGGGLSKFNIKTQALKNYEMANGLPNNIIFSIAPGIENTLWLSTDYGLSQFNLETEEFINFDQSDGLQDEHFFWGAACISHDNEIFFGGVNGVNSFYPEKVRHNNFRHKLFITNIRVLNEPLKTNTPVEFLKEIELNYKQNFLVFNFSVLDYANPAKNKFKVKLEGLEENWKDLGNQRTTSYSNLRPGNYVLKISSQARSYGDKPSSTHLKIKINPPWYLKWWAISLAVILVFLLMLSIYRLGLKVLLNQRHKLALKVKERTREILEKNTVLAQRNKEILEQKEELTAKNIQLIDALNKLSEAKEKVVEAEKMASIGVLAAGVAHEINNPLNFIQGGVWGIENHLAESHCYKSAETQTFLNAIKEGIARAVAIVSSLNQFSRTSTSITEICDIHAIIDNCVVITSNQYKHRVNLIKNFASETNLEVLGNGGKLHQLFLNIITNAEQAIPNKGEVIIETKVIDKMIQISITDNGTGIEENILGRITEPFFTTKDPGKGTGLGLSIAYRIVEEHKGYLNFSSKFGEGTTVFITLPLKSSN